MSNKTFLIVNAVPNTVQVKFSGLFITNNRVF